MAGNKTKTRRFSYTNPIMFQGSYYPTAEWDIQSDTGEVNPATVFADANGSYYTLDNNGSAIPVMPFHNLDEVTVTAPKKQDVSANAFGRYLTMSNDKTQVNNLPHREYNTHLKENAEKGAKEHALWEKEHPNLTAWGEIAGAIPFGVASIPLVAGTGQTLLGTVAGQAVKSGATKVLANPLVEAANGAIGLGFAGKGAYDISQGKFTPETALELLPLTQAVKPITNVTKKLGDVAWHSTYAQYPRYYAGKLYYGTDVEIPTLYRKIKSTPIVKDGKVQITTPNNRFAYINNGEENPIITNMTTDVPVRSHNGGNWDSADVLAFPGKTLLGKNIISTRPSDTFTFGDNITVPASKVTFYSGDKNILAKAETEGIRTVTTPTLQKVIDDAEELANSTGIQFRKPNYGAYTNEMQRLTRENHRSPTLKDYKFMDWVFQPKYKSEVYPFQDLSNIQIDDLGLLPEVLFKKLGNTTSRKSLLNPKEWRNVLYDPATTAEENFRSSKGIDLKNRIIIK